MSRILFNIYIFFTYIYVYICVYIYIYREIDREGEDYSISHKILSHMEMYIVETEDIIQWLKTGELER